MRGFEGSGEVSWVVRTLLILVPPLVLFPPRVLLFRAKSDEALCCKVGAFCLSVDTDVPREAEIKEVPLLAELLLVFITLPRSVQNLTRSGLPSQTESLK